MSDGSPYVAPHLARSQAVALLKWAEGLKKSQQVAIALKRIREAVEAR